MNIDRGVMRGLLRFNLSLQTMDGDTHSLVSQNQALFEAYADNVRTFAQQRLEELVASRIPQAVPVVKQKQHELRTAEAGEVTASDVALSNAAEGKTK